MSFVKPTIQRAIEDQDRESPVRSCHLNRKNRTLDSSKWAWFTVIPSHVTVGRCYPRRELNGTKAFCKLTRPTTNIFWMETERFCPSQPYRITHLIIQSTILLAIRQDSLREFSITFPDYCLLCNISHTPCQVQNSCLGMCDKVSLWLLWHMASYNKFGVCRSPKAFLHVYQPRAKCQGSLDTWIWFPPYINFTPINQILR